MTPELRASRLGKLTASVAAIIMGDLSNKTLKDLCKSLAFERVYGDPEEDRYQSRAMARGSEVEPQALDWYTFHTDRVPDRTAVTIDHPSIPWVAATPDARLPDRVVEAKCPLHKAWMEAKERMEVPSQYRWQVKWQMWVCGVGLCDFVVWHHKAGGLLIEAELADDDAVAMAARAELVNRLIQNWVDILQER